MKKKILSVLLAATLVVSLFAGCGKSKKDNIIKVGAICKDYIIRFL